MISGTFTMLKFVYSWTHRGDIEVNWTNSWYFILVFISSPVHKLKYLFYSPVDCRLCNPAREMSSSDQLQTPQNNVELLAPAFLWELAVPPPPDDRLCNYLFTSFLLPNPAQFNANINLFFQLFLHRVFGYRGVALFPWISKVYDRDISKKSDPKFVFLANLYLSFSSCDLCLSGALFTITV